MSKPIWVVQNCKDRQTELILDALRTTKEPHILVSLRPGDLVTSIAHLGNNFIPYGSTTLMKIAWDAGWLHVFSNPENFNVDAYNKNHPSMLNSNAVTMTLSAAKELSHRNSQWFIRPIDDNKGFAGEVFTSEQLVEWVTALESLEDCAITPNTLVSVNFPKAIAMEWRYFIVNGVIVSGSIYRRHGESYLEDETDYKVLKEAQELADKWLPHPCCVMDVALCDTTPYVIEFNSLNASGFYKHDVPAIVRAVAQYVAAK